MLPDPPLFTIVAVSQEYLQTTGREQEELVGKGLSEVFSDNISDLDAIRISLQLALLIKESQLLITQRYDLAASNGGPAKCYWAITNKPVVNGQGDVLYLLHSIQEHNEHLTPLQSSSEDETTLQKMVAERTAELEKQKQFIASILEASMGGIYALKAIRDTTGAVIDFQYLFVNNYIARTLNRRAEEIIGSPMLSLIPENRDNGFMELFLKLLETGESFQGETHFVAQCIDSWYQFVIVPLDSETLVVTIEDITEKKTAALQIEEQRNLLDNILRNSSNGISVSRIFRNEQGRVIDALTILANDAAVKYIGLPKDIYLTKRATELEPNIIDSPYYQNCVRTLQTGEPFMTQYLMESSGRWLELTVSKLDDNHLIQVFSDVTPIKEAQLRLERSIEELRHSNKNLEAFAYAASHDLKEPTRKILIFSERLKESLGEKLTDSERKYFERMQVASKRMNTLIEDLLTYSEVSQRAALKEAVDMNQVIDQVLSDLDLEIEQKGAVINVDRLFTFRGYRRQLQQAFQNLIGNALKYSKPDESPQISITCSKVKGADTNLFLPADQLEQNFYLVTVMDNGIGFDQADADRIFNVFTRLHGMAEYRGTGVGLSIVKKVMENHHGYIWAEASLGAGAFFKLLFPC